MEVPKQTEPPRPMALFEQGYVNAMSHFYRGELGRIMIWRQRLDTTTNWAITATTTIFTVAFTVRDLSHIIFFFNVVVLWVLLWIEARRYRFYDAFRARVRMLEAHFLVPMVMENKQMLAGDWKKLICEDLILPSFKISMFEAVGRRLKRNYVFLFLIVLVAWTTKIIMHSPVPISSFGAFFDALSVNHIPGFIVATLFFGTLLTVISINAYIVRHSSGEISEFGSRREEWRL
jgi:uncharacterized membrane protein